MTEDQNKPTKTTAVTKAEGDKAAAAGSRRGAGAAGEHPKDKKGQSTKAADRPKADTAEGRKSVGQYVRDQRRARLLAIVSGLALLLALGALSATYWLWQQNIGERQRRVQQQEQLQEQLQTRIGDLRQRQQQGVHDSNEQRRALEQRLNKQIDEALASLEKQQSATVEPDWLLAEALYLVRVADHRLQLVGDVDTAVSALMLADQRLFATRDPRVTPARRQIKNDINRLRALPDVDTVGIALSLSSLQQQVATLPLNRAARHGDDTGQGDDAEGAVSWFDSLLASLKGLVSIRRVDDKSTAIVPPEQRGFLFQNLALKLEAARFALLSGDDALYHQSLATVSDWLDRYFNAEDSAVQAMMSSVRELDSVKLNPELPDLGASLQAVQTVMSRRRQAAEQAAAPSRPPEPSTQQQVTKPSDDGRQDRDPERPSAAEGGGQ